MTIGSIGKLGQSIKSSVTVIALFYAILTALGSNVDIGQQYIYVTLSPINFLPEQKAA